MAVVIFSFAGIELIAISAPETRDAPRALRTAMRSMMFRLALFYIGALAVILSVTPWQQAASGGSVESSPFVTMFSAAGIPAAAAVTNALVLITALSSANANLYAGTRMLHSLGGDGLAPPRSPPPTPTVCRGGRSWPRRPGWAWPPCSPASSARVWPHS
jgi:L-asparagine transporter-like permease